MALGSSESTQLKNPKNSSNIYASIRKAEKDYKINPNENLSNPEKYIY